MHYLAFAVALLFCLFQGLINHSAAQQPAERQFSRADTLRGSYGEFRQKWNLLHYDLLVEPDLVSKTIRGSNSMRFMDSGISKMQVDLQEPMELDSVIEGTERLTFTREQNVFWINIAAAHRTPSVREFKFFFHGKPREAVMPPWDGGWIWKTDGDGNPWVTTATQGLGASVWYPCKDTQADEPDSGAILRIVVPDSLMAISNGRLLSQTKQDGSRMLFSWKVESPINNYCLTPYIGKYVHFSEKFDGEKGKLDVDYWVLPVNLEKAKMQFKDASKMMKAFEHWFGPYPFYKDGFKIVEAPMLGMEHQSAIAYGNLYKNGYNNGRYPWSWSDSKWEQMFDYIVIHEGGHEWFGNNITSKDIADMWLHESFTTYGEVLFIENEFGKQASLEYLYGTRKNLQNEQPMIGPYNVNADGDLDIYFKGSNFIHTLRQLINNDVKFRALLRQLNQVFYHQTVTSKQVENFISKSAGIKLNKVFDQYLRTTKIPVLAYYRQNGKLFYKWEDVVPGFDMPIRVTLGKRKKQLSPTTAWKSVSLKEAEDFVADRGYLVNVRASENF